MASNNRAQFIIDLVGNVTSRARQFGASIRRFGSDGSRSMRLFGSAVQGTNRLLDRFDNRLTGFVVGGGLMMAAKKVADHQQQVVDLGTTYNLTANQVTQLDAAISQIAARRRILPADLTSAAQQFLQGTNDYQATLDNLDNLASSLNGLKLQAADTGATLATLFTSGKEYKTPDGMRRWLDMMASASQMGTGNIADQARAAATLTKSTHWQSLEAQAQAIALQRVAAAEFNDPAQADAAVQNFFAAITSSDGRKILRDKGGVKVTDQYPADLAIEIGQAAKYKPSNLKDVTAFSDDAIKLIMALSDAQKRDQVKQLSDPGNIVDGMLEQKAMQSVDTLNGALVSLTNAGDRWMQLNLGRPVQELADAINDLSPETLDNYAATIGKVGAALAGVIAVRYTWRWGKKGYDWLSGSAPGRGNGPGGAGGALGVQRVFVTNWPLGLSAPGGRGGPGGVVAGGGLVGKLGLAGMVAASVSEPIESGLNWAFGDTQYYANLRYAQTWREFGDALLGQDTVKKGEDGQWYSLTEEDKQRYRSPGAVQPSAYLTGQSSMSSRGISYGAMPLTREQDTPTPPPVPEGKITVKVVAPDNLQVKATAVQSNGVDLRVSTGHTYGLGL